MSNAGDVATCPRCGRDNPEGFSFCGFCTAALQPRPEALERKIVSVLFVDLVGFTARSDALDPEDVKATLAPYHARLKQEIERFGGTVEKFVGDAVMGMFGAPVSHEDDAERAVRAALRIADAIEELNTQYPHLKLAIRGAVNSGEAVVALDSRPEAGEVIVTGDVVNTASRLQGVAPVGAIVVGEQTYLSTKGVIDYAALDPVVVKGKPSPIQIYRALDAKSRYGVDVRVGYDTPFLGRAAELEVLVRSFDRTVNDDAVQLVTVVGEPGVGKSRLVSEFARDLDDRTDLVAWRQGRCLPYGDGITFWALAEVVKAQCGILESDRINDARAKLTSALDGLIDDGADRTWVGNRLSPLIGVSASGAAEQSESFAAWRRFLEEIAIRTPFVIVFEDLHWAGKALLELVEHLVDWATGVPLFILCTARPELYESYPGWGGGKKNSATLSLAPLSDSDTKELVQSLAAAVHLPDDVTDEVITRSGGNPLYAEEFCRMVADHGGWDEGHASVPATVHALIAARLDTLAADRKALLHDAAVVGKVFWSGALAAMGGIDKQSIEVALHELARKELVRRQRSSSVAGQTEYSFWHALVRDVAYSEIPRAQRADKHVAAAEWIELIAGERVADHAELLASHYGEALMLARAIGSDEVARECEGPTAHFLLMAGDRTTGLDVRKAARYFDQAVELIGEGHPDRPTALLKAARATYHSGRVAEAEPLCELAVEAFRTRGERIRSAAAMVDLALLKRELGRTARGRTLLREAIEVLESEPPGPELAEAYVRAARDAGVASRFLEEQLWAGKALSLASDIGRRDIEVEARMRRGLALHDLGKPGGREDMERALRDAVELELVWLAGIAYNNLADVVWFEEGPEKGLKIFREGIDFSDRRGLVYNSLWNKGSMAFALIDAGRWDDALDAAVQILRWEREAGTSQLGIMAANATSWVLTHRGEVHKAAKVAAEELPRAREAQDPQMLWTTLGVAAQVARAQGNDGDAVALLEELADKAGRESHEVWGEYNRLDCIRLALELRRFDLAQSLLERSGTRTVRQQHAGVTGRALLAEAAGDLEEALGLYQDSVRSWAEFGNEPERAHALLGQAQCLLAMERAGAETLLREAARIYRTLRATPFLERAERLLRDAGDSAPSANP